MSIISDSARRRLPLAIGLVTLVVVAALLVRDAAPRVFSARSHDILAAFSLAMIAVAYIAFQVALRRDIRKLAKAILLAAAFLFWAANQFWPNLPQAGLFNDIAIALFVLDVFLVIAGKPDVESKGAASSIADGAEASDYDCCVK